METGAVTMQAFAGLARLAGRKRLGAALRRYPRLPCFVPSPLLMVERRCEIFGAVMEISRGGLLYREASTYILDRRGWEVSIRLMGVERTGRIVNVGSQGYGISLDELLDDAMVETIASEPAG